jgi:phosphatidylcholine synthase
MQRTPSLWLQASAAAVHLYTASGAVLAFLIVLAAIGGDAVGALWLLLIALIIDSTDGSLARRFRVSETLPWFDGRRLDDIVDYLTYVFAPVLLLWMGGYLPNGVGGMILATMPLLASSYQFCRVDAKTDDHFFLGFPSYWNVVAFYAIVYSLESSTVAVILVVFSLLVFVPIRYVYPSRTVTFRPLTLAFTALWVLLYTIILLQMPEPALVLAHLSLLYLVYYVLLSLYLTWKTRPAR